MTTIRSKFSEKHDGCHQERMRTKNRSSDEPSHADGCLGATGRSRAASVGCRNPGWRGASPASANGGCADTPRGTRGGADPEAPTATPQASGRTRVASAWPCRRRAGC